MKKPLQKRICVVCGKEFLPKTKNGLLCSDECKRKRAKAIMRKRMDDKTRSDFSRGRVWQLDMEKWQWELKKTENS